MEFGRSDGLQRVGDFLEVQKSQTTANFLEFESAVIRAKDIYESMPAELRFRIFRQTRGRNYGDDPRTALFGIMDEAASLLEALRVTCGYKLCELATGIWEGFSPQRSRMAVLSCRTLYEDAAAAKYYGDQAEAAINDLVSSPPTAYRLQRLSKLLATKAEESKALLEKTSAPGKILKKWYSVRKMDWSKPDYFVNHKLDERDPLYPRLFKSAFKSLRWQHDIPASYFYDVLCEATHPNVLSNTLYVDDTSGSDERQLVYLIRKNCVTIEPLMALYTYVSVPTVECVKIVDEYITKLAVLRSELAKYLDKARRVTT